MTSDWLVPLAKGLFWLVAMTLTMRWLARSRHRPRPAAAGNCVQHPASILATGIVGTLLFAGVMVAATIWPDEGVGFLFYAFFTGMVLMSAYMVADYYLARHVITDGGMDVGRPTGRRLSFRWTEVERVHFSKAANWFRIHLQSGETVRVSGMMMGLPAFAGQVLRHVPPARIDKDTLRMLENAAKGQLPPVWE